MTIHFPAPRMAGIAASPASVLRKRAQELRSAGRDVIELSSGNLHFATPDHVIAAAHDAALRGDTGYTNVDGTPALKDAVRATLWRQNGLDYGRDEIVVTTGTTQAIFNALFATLAPGDEVIVPAPYWAPYLDQVRLAHGIPVIVPCSRASGFKLRPEDLDAAITERTRWVILNNPVNPSGAVYSPAELAALADVLLRYPDVWIIADGLYEHIVFDGRRAATLAEVEPRLRARTLTVGGVAKSYAMMGWRIGYAGGPARLIREMVKIQSQTTSCASSISQAAALAALTGPQQLLQERAAELAGNGEAFADLLNGCDRLSCRRPEGTFYLVADCAGWIGRRTASGATLATDRNVAAWLLDAADVTVFPGTDFGLSPAFRVSFALPPATIETAGRRIQRACAELLP